MISIHLNVILIFLRLHFMLLKLVDLHLLIHLLLYLLILLFCLLLLINIFKAIQFLIFFLLHPTLLLKSFIMRHLLLITFSIITPSFLKLLKSIYLLSCLLPVIFQVLFVSAQLKIL